MSHQDKVSHSNNSGGTTQRHASSMDEQRIVFQSKLFAISDPCGSLCFVWTAGKGHRYVAADINWRDVPAALKYLIPHKGWS